MAVDYVLEDLMNKLGMSVVGPGAGTREGQSATLPGISLPG